MGFVFDQEKTICEAKKNKMVTSQITDKLVPHLQCKTTFQEREVD